MGESHRQPNMILATLSGYLEDHNSSHNSAAPAYAPSASEPPKIRNKNCGGRFNNREREEKKLIEHIKNRSMRGIEKSIARGASVKTSDYNKSDPPIMIAIDCGFKDIVKLLLEHKQLDINEKASNGHTPLSYAKMRRKRDMIQLLQDKGAND